MFKRHRYPRVIILQAVYFKCRFTLSYRDIEELLKIRGIEVDHSTIQRWVFKFSKQIEATMHKRKHQVVSSWRMDETYIKVGGKDRYLYRAVDKKGNTVDFLLTKRRMKGSAQKFLNKVIGNNGQDHRSIKRRITITTGFKEFESAQRTLSGIEVVHMIRKDQIKDSKSSTFKTFCSLAS